MANEDVTCLETLEIRNCSISSDTRMNQALTGILQEPPELLETFDIRYIIKYHTYSDEIIENRRNTVSKPKWFASLVLSTYFSLSGTFFRLFAMVSP